MLLRRSAFLASWFKLCFQDLSPAVSLLVVCIWAITFGSSLALTKQTSRFLVVCAIFSTAWVFSSKMFVHVFIYLVMILLNFVRNEGGILIFLLLKGSHPT